MRQYEAFFALLVLGFVAFQPSSALVAFNLCMGLLSKERHLAGDGSQAVSPNRFFLAHHLLTDTLPLPFGSDVGVIVGYRLRHFENGTAVGVLAVIGPCADLMRLCVCKSGLFLVIVVHGLGIFLDLSASSGAKPGK